MYDALLYPLKEFRQTLDVTQAQMAEAMGMPLRSYQDIEAGINPVRPIHVKAAQFAAIVFASNGRGRDVLPIELQTLVDQAGRSA